MQERVSQSLRSGEIGHTVEPGTTVFIDDAARGIIKVVSGSGIPGQIEDQLEIRADFPVRKPCQVSLLTWELKR